MPAIICPSCNCLTNTVYRTLGNTEDDTQCRMRLNTTTGTWEMGCSGLEARSWDETKLGQPLIINDDIVTVEEIQSLRQRLIDDENSRSTT